jgi:hypothetical protein
MNLRLSEHVCIKESQQPWSVTQPPPKTAPAVRVHIMLTVLMCALATAYRRAGTPGKRQDGATVHMMLGHTKIAMTLDIYSHVSLDLEKKAAVSLNAVLRG